MDIGKGSIDSSGIDAQPSGIVDGYPHEACGHVVASAPIENQAGIVESADVDGVKFDEIHRRKVDAHGPARLPGVPLGLGEAQTRFGISRDR